ncbi:MAG: single-stranded DNA-binding protein [Bacteroidales bacterium]|nr:single-stranded DNA-binding protein [Bacteroidales bacterium]
MKDLRNRVQLIGNLGMDPEMVNLDNGKKIAKFSLATSQSYIAGNGEKITDTQWHNIVAWGNLAERSEKYLKKGSPIAVEGRIVYRQYDDKAGQKRYITEIVMNDMLFLSKKEE